MSENVPSWPFGSPPPPESMKQLAVEMMQLTVALTEAGFAPNQVEVHVNYQILVGLFGIRSAAAGQT
jgi:hypothetical protein